MSENCCDVNITKKANKALKTVLWLVFAINIIMFLVEITAGYIYHSSALMADSLDMLADAFVYGVSILVLSKSDKIKAQVSLVKGFVMTLLALYVVYELIVRILYPTLPDGQAITIVGIIALTANAVSFSLLNKYKDGDINMRSSWVCSRNDMLANTGVILAGISVVYLGSSWPDYVIGALIAGFVTITSVSVIIDSFKAFKSAKKLEKTTQ